MKINKWMRVSLALMLVAALAGCASTGGGSRGPSDEELLQGMADQVLEALKTKDIATMVSFFADDFSSDNGGKADTEAFLQGAADQGFLDGLEVDTTAMEIAVDGMTSNVGPISLEGAFGALTVSFGLEKRDSDWVVTSMSQSM
jgi:hypothetical protein